MVSLVCLRVSWWHFDARSLQRVCELQHITIKHPNTLLSCSALGECIILVVNLCSSSSLLILILPAIWRASRMKWHVKGSFYSFCASIYRRSATTKLSRGWLPNILALTWHPASVCSQELQNLSNSCGWEIIFDEIEVESHFKITFY